MSDVKKLKYLTKTVKFGSNSLTLYSIDGLTWSSKKQELTVIKDRLENQRVTLGGVKSEDDEGAKDKPEKDDEPVVTSTDDDDEVPVKAAKVDADDEDDDLIVEDVEVDDDIDDDLPAVSKRGKAKDVDEDGEDAPQPKARKTSAPGTKKAPLVSEPPAKKNPAKPAKKGDARAKKRAA